MTDDLLQTLPELMESLAHASQRERDLWVLRGYHGLDGEPPRTWQEIGDELGLTRERARQLGRIFTLDLRAALFDEVPGFRTVARGRGLNHVPVPEWAMEEVGELQETLAREVFYQESEVVRLLSPSLEAPLGPTERAHVPYLLELVGWTSESGSNLGLSPSETCWAEGSPVKRDSDGAAFLKEVAAVVREAKHLLNAHPEGLTTERWVTESCARAGCQPADLDDMESILNLIPRLDHPEPGRVWWRMADLPTNADRAWRILREAGEPRHFREVTRTLNDTVQRERREGDPEHADTPPIELSRAMSNDDRFEPIGRTGKWKITEWRQVSGDPVADLIERTLRDVGGALDMESLWVEVHWHRPDATLKTVRAMVYHNRDRFVSDRGGDVRLRKG